MTITPIHNTIPLLLGSHILYCDSPWSLQALQATTWALIISYWPLSGGINVALSVPHNVVATASPIFAAPLSAKIEINFRAPKLVIFLTPAKRIQKNGSASTYDAFFMTSARCMSCEVARLATCYSHLRIVKVLADCNSKNMSSSDWKMNKWKSNDGTKTYKGIVLNRVYRHHKPDSWHLGHLMKHFV